MSNEKRTIGISALLALAIVTGGIFAPTFFDSDKYVCVSRPELSTVECDSFSKYVSEQGKCIRDDNTNLICREGWLLVTDDRSLPEEYSLIDDSLPIADKPPPAAPNVKFNISDLPDGAVVIGNRAYLHTGDGIVQKYTRYGDLIYVGALADMTDANTVQNYDEIVSALDIG